MGIKELDGRLSCIAGLVPPCSVAADVGTDHGFLIAHLVETGRVERGIAIDVNAAPLEKARRLLALRGLEDRVETRLADGLQGVSPDGLGAVIIARMGGELIWEIIRRWPHAATPGIAWVLQPMTKIQRLRRSLWDGGFAIREERCCNVAGKSYSVLLATFAGAPQLYEPWQAYLGAVTPETPEARTYLLREQQRLLAIIEARGAAGEDAAQTAVLRRAAREIEARLAGWKENTP